MDIMFPKPQELKKKSNLPKAERTFIQINRGAEKLPAPSAYNPEVVMTDCEKKVKNKTEFFHYKKFKDHASEINKRHKELKDRDDTRHNEIISKQNPSTITKNPKPLPNDFMTFEKLALLYKDLQPGKAVKKKGKHFLNYFFYLNKF